MMQKRMWGPVCLAVVFAHPILAQTWTQKSPAVKPPAMYFPALASLEQQQKIVLFAGQTGNNTWLWDGVTWTQGPTPQAAPGYYAIAADSASSVVAFGGNDGNEFEPGNQTWRFDGATWTQIGGTAPSFREGAAMAYDRDAGQIVMYGGGGGTALFKNSAWTQVADTFPCPLVTWGQALAYDADRRRVVLFGGMGLKGAALNETWVWDSSSTTWTQKTPAHSPPARVGHALVYDSAAHRVVLFGGAKDGTFGFSDTWTWDGTDWTQLNLTTAPPARVFFGFAGRSWAGDAVLFGGDTWTTGSSGASFNNDTWVWQALPYTALVQQPINPNGSSIFNANRGVVPVKFTLAQGGIQTCTLPPATISVQRISNGTATGIDVSVYTQAADSGSNFRIDSPNCQYVYNLSAPSLGAGTYEVKILISGDAVGSATFGLK